LILRILVGSNIDIKNIQFRVDSLRHSARARDQVLSRGTGAHANPDPLSQRETLADSFPFQVRLKAAIDRPCDLLQGELSKCDQVTGAKKMSKRPFRAIERIDISAAHPRLQSLRSQVRQYDLIHFLHHPVRYCLPHLYSSDVQHGGNQALDVLHVHRRYDIDLGIQQIHHVLVALGMLGAFDVGVRQFVHQYDLGLPRQDGVQVHFVKNCASIFNLATRNRFQFRSQLRDAGAAVRFYNSDNDVFAPTMPPDALAQHVKSFSNAGGVAEEELEHGLFLSRLCFFQPLLGCLRHRPVLSSGIDRNSNRLESSHVKRPLNNPILRLLACIVIVAGIVLLFSRWLHVNPTTVGFSFLLAVLLISTTWGLRYAIFTAIIATAAYNFFFLPPLFRFTIADPQNWIALVAFLVTAGIASQLSERARRGTEYADQRRLEVERLYAFSQQLWLSENVFELLNLIPKHIVESFDISGAALFLEGKQETYFFDDRSRTLFPSDQLKSISDRGEPVLDRPQRVCFMPVRMGVRSVGALGLSGCDLSRESLEAIGSLVAIAIERTNTVEKLTRSEAARESDRLRSVLLDSVTHEFRTPLTSIKASAETLLSDVQLDKPQRTDLLQVINEESDRLNRLVGEAGEVAQLDAHQLQFHFEPHQMREVIDKAVKNSQPALRNHPVTINFPPNLPLVRMDFDRITEVISQLLDNAGKYSPPDTPVHISVDAQGPEVITSVADQGPGIDEMEQEMIFEKFYRGRDQRMIMPGTGMGLPIAKAIVELHGGKIGLTSQLGRGSVFHFSLPLGAQ
jgi:two-component system sensor histidine kinase KdpD